MHMYQQNIVQAQERLKEKNRMDFLVKTKFRCENERNVHKCSLMVYRRNLNKEKKNRTKNLAVTKCRHCDYIFVSSSALCDFNSKELCIRNVCHTKTSRQIIVVWSVCSFILVFVKSLRPKILIYICGSQNMFCLVTKLKRKCRLNNFCHRNVYGHFVWIVTYIFVLNIFSFPIKAQVFLIVIGIGLAEGQAQWARPLRRIVLLQSSSLKVFIINASDDNCSDTSAIHLQKCINYLKKHESLDAFTW